MDAIPRSTLSPEQRRQRTLEALTAQVAGLARQNPVLMIFEDAHWTDPTSLEAFGRTVDRIKTLPVLLIVTFRPEFDAAVDRTVACDEPDAQPAWRSVTSAAMIDAPCRQQGATGGCDRRRSSSAPTASRCSWRR